MQKAEKNSDEKREKKKKEMAWACSVVPVSVHKKKFVRIASRVNTHRHSKSSYK
jgi:hypothetical protein